MATITKTREVEYILDRYGNRVEFKDKVLRQHVDELNATARNAVDTANEAKNIANSAREYVEGVEDRCETAAGNAEDSAGAAKTSEENAAESARQAAESAESAAGSAETASQAAENAAVSEELARKAIELINYIKGFDLIDLVKTDTDGTTVVLTVLGKLKEKQPATVGESEVGDAIIKSDKISYTNVAITDAGYPVGGEEVEPVVITYHTDGSQRVLDMSWQDIYDAFPNVVIADGDTLYQVTEVYNIDNDFYVSVPDFISFYANAADEYPREMRTE